MEPNQPSVYRLQNTVQRYDWGSRTAIPLLLGVVPDGEPAAELWLGAHPSAPSLIPESSLVLSDLIRAQPANMLGARVANKYGPELPYLAKILAADRALSLQVHPKPHLARAGYNRENRTGVPHDARHRSFHDPRHKPEMIVALTEFEAMAGLRAPRVALRALDGFESPIFERMRANLQADRLTGTVRESVTDLLAMREHTDRPDWVARAIAEVEARVASGGGDQTDKVVLLLAEQHSEDIGIFSPYLLNRVTLQPGESLFLAAGEVHAYIHGVGVEIMANSDNVLRAGLTSKHVDTSALLECMSFEAKPIARPAHSQFGTKSRADQYRAPVSEFALTLFDIVPAEPLDLPHDGPRIVQILEGDLTLTHDFGTTRLLQGESAFVPHHLGAVQISGDGRAFSAWVP
ncbi:MAG: mannose-6-phosphate isomerase, class I [Cellulomonadaceae bacterium]|nr:mannose-6-phosphate isomerase, class I [Cellulomonadaceae bacterium]